MHVSFFFPILVSTLLAIYATAEPISGTCFDGNTCQVILGVDGYGKSCAAGESCTTGCTIDFTTGVCSQDLQIPHDGFPERQANKRQIAVNNLCKLLIEQTRLQLISALTFRVFPI
jgi:hypothetical protein